MFGKLGLEGVNPALDLCIWSFIIIGIMLGWLLLNRDVSPLLDVSMTSWGLIALEGYVQLF